MKVSDIQSTILDQRNYFELGKTKDISFRIQQLNNLKKLIVENEDDILTALKSDMNKPDVESYASEIGFVINEINYTIKKLHSWAAPKRVSTPFVLLLSSSRVYSEPYGVVLIIGPWNYPFQLVISPLIGAIAAGNCSILKPSEVSSRTSQLISNLFQKYFDPGFISVIEGDAGITQMLLIEKFDYIFYTGGTVVGRIIMEAAAKNLTPVTLELGGKSPCIVDSDIHIDYTARRIVWGKYFNAGQTCIAPDYLLVNKVVKRELLESMKKYIVEFYGSDPQKSPDYARIINEKHFLRLSNLLKEGTIMAGGEKDADDKYIAPTIIDNVSLKHEIMKEEIFGPILSIIEYDDLSQAISIVKERPKPLALYFFSKNKSNQERVVREISSGGVCINDTLVHVSNLAFSFGGVGDSGIGQYRGVSSFDTFSHKKSILKHSFLFDMKLRYPPYKNKLKLFKRLL